MSLSNALVLEVLKQDSQLLMSLTQQEERASTLKHYSRLSVSTSEIEKLCREAMSAVDKTEESLKKSGRMLWDHLLTRQVKEDLLTTSARSLTLSLDEELIHVPWELFYDGRDFLCLRYNTGRLVRTKTQAARVQYRSCASTHKMLILANPTNDLKDAYQEGLSLKNQFDHKRNSISIDFKSTHIDKLYVKKSLKEYEIVHFAGHAEFDSDNPRHTGWILSDGKFTPADILSIGESVSMPSLVFSNACYSALSGATHDFQEKNYSLASAFLFSGVRHYIGAIRRIEDPQSESFARNFYAHLLSGKAVGESMRLSRLKLAKERPATGLSWASYILYGDPDFILLKDNHRPKTARAVIRPSAYKKWLVPFVMLFLLAAAWPLINRWLPTVNPRAYALFMQAQELFVNGNNAAVISLSTDIISSDPKFLATYPQLAETYTRLGQLDNALKTYFDYALMSEKRRNAKSLAAAYTGIGWTYFLRKEYPLAFDFYNKAIKLAREGNDLLNEAIALRKLAVLDNEQGNYDLALGYLLKSSEINRERLSNPEHRYNLACDYFDIALVFSNKNDFAAAKEFYAKSRVIFEKLQLKKELSDYYFNLGEIYQGQKEYQKALDYFDKGLKIDLAQANMLNLVSDYEMFADLYREMGDNAKSKEYSRLSEESGRLEK
ncbi:MAG: CHAT domain-containing protein [Candidatus Omnitrophica bacterium]|nr:CHAT domain-containing protein [Candidatus Omnitrophota bacterium]